MGKSFDKAEFERVLKRAVELDEDLSEMLSEGDLHEAGRELGLRPESVRAALLEAVEAERVRQHPRPFDTSIALEARPDRLRLHVPAKGFTMTSVVQAIFSVAWLVFLVLFVTDLGKTKVDLMFAVPIVGLGVFLLRAWVSDAFRVDELTLAPKSGELRFRLGPFTWRQRVEPRHVRFRWKPETTDDSGRSTRTVPAHMLVEHGVRATKIMRGRSEAELRWVDEELSYWLLGARSA